MGYRILQRNYRYEYGEIDLVAQDGDELVFVEVKAWTTSSFGDPEDAVDEGKQSHITHAAEGYLSEQDVDEKTIARFDVVSISYRGGTPHIEHIKDAF